MMNAIANGSTCVNGYNEPQLGKDHAHAQDHSVLVTAIAGENPTNLF